MNYGVPYKGSKNLIVTKLAEAIPGAENFYDLFAGGCAVTHKMLECGRFKHGPLNERHCIVCSFQLCLVAFFFTFQSRMQI